MVVLNKNFKNAVAAEMFGGFFNPTTNSNKYFDKLPHTGVLATNSSLVAARGDNVTDSVTSDAVTFDNATIPGFLGSLPSNNLFIVTDHFLKVVDKIYTKLWNESFTETGIYDPAVLQVFYHTFVETNPSDFMSMKSFVARCISTGILDSGDALVDDDQIAVTGLTKNNISTNLDLDAGVITYNINIPAKLYRNIDSTAGKYLNGKKLYLFFTPYLSNYSVDTSTIIGNLDAYTATVKEIFSGVTRFTTYRQVHKPYTKFKPKTSNSKFGGSVLMGTHLIWQIGTPADKELAIAEGTSVPEIIFDHTDKISHLDKLSLKVNLGTVII